jgi:hypothetical protein
MGELNVVLSLIIAYLPTILQRTQGRQITQTSFSTIMSRNRGEAVDLLIVVFTISVLVIRVPINYCPRPLAVAYCPPHTRAIQKQEGIKVSGVRSPQNSAVKLPSIIIVTLVMLRIIHFSVIRANKM